MKIYKKDSKGNMRVAEIYPLKDRVYQITGLVDGNKVTNISFSKAKNVGKSNETTAEEQAVLDANSKIEKKLKEGYFKTQKEAENSKVILPMLAHEYEKHSHKVKGDMWLQPKLDGMRCLAIVKDGNCKLISRTNREIETMNHIVDFIEENFTGDFILDGELYVHGEDFQTNMEYVKSYKEGLSERIQFCVYDTVSDEDYGKRYIFIDELLGELNDQPVDLVMTVKAGDGIDLKYMHDQFVELGYEGMMVRHGDKGYKSNGRSDSLLKVKVFQDIACKITDIVPANKVPSWGKPILEWNGKTFSAGTKMSHDAREDLLANKADYIGKTAEIRYFELSQDGIPRFPVMHGIRLDK